jgi:hypothetical protein
VTTGKKIIESAITAKANAETQLRLLGETDNPLALVQNLAPHDLLVAWDLADDEQRTDLLKLADREQAALLMDIHCWRGDVPDMEALERFVEPLVMSGIGGAFQVIDLLGEELRTLLLKSNVRVHLLEDRNEVIEVPDGSEMIVCPDGRYHLEFPDPDRVTDVERAIWGALLYRPFEQYQLEMECVIHDFPSELQENALRWRSGRLADYGFATREEAISILVPRTVEEVRTRAMNTDSTHYPLSAEFRLPVLYQENLSGHAYFDRVVNRLQLSEHPETQARVEQLGTEISAMTNYFLTATGVDIGNLESVALGIRRARDILALGLSATAAGDVDRGAEFLLRLVPGTLLQAGLGLVYPLRDRARALLGDKRFASGRDAGALFDPPYQVGLTCLALDIPCRWPPLEGPDGVAASLFRPQPDELEAISSAADLEAADRLLAETEILGTLLFEVLAYREPTLRETPASVLVLTALANAAGGRDALPHPLTYQEARVFGEGALAADPARFLSDALGVLAPPLGVSADGAERLGDETDPGRRLLMRLIQIGRARLAADAPERVLLVEPV